MNTNGEMNYKEMMASMIQNLADSDDPYKKMLGQVMLQNAQNSAQESISPVPPPRQADPVQVQKDIKTLIAMNRGLIAECKMLISQKENLEQLNRYAAAAFGACECWGLNKECAQCGGAGLPGSLEIDEQKFTRLAAPLFEKLANVLHPPEIEKEQ